MTQMILGITGHRPSGIDGDYTYTSDKWEWIRNQMKQTFMKINPEKIYTGMALGCDTIAAELAIDLQIPFVAAVPFVGQESSWNSEQQTHYRALLSMAKSVVTIGTSDQVPWIYQKRNEYMVNNADLMVAVYNGARGGTRNCVEYAIKNKTTVWRIDPRTEKVGRYDGTVHIGKTLHV